MSEKKESNMERDDGDESEPLFAEWGAKPNRRQITVMERFGQFITTSYEDNHYRRSSVVRSGLRSRRHSDTDVSAIRLKSLSILWQLRARLNPLLGPLCPLPAILKKNLLHTSTIDTLRAYRVAAFTVMVLMQIVVIFQHNVNQETGPVASDLRDNIFRDQDSIVETIMETTWGPTMGRYMSTTKVIDFLNSMQQICNDQDLLGDNMDDIFVCEIARIDWTGIQGNNRFHELPCDKDTLDRYVEAGDHSPYGDMIQPLKEYYEKHSVDKDEQWEPQFHNLRGWKLYNSFFNGPNVQNDRNNLGPLPRLNEKLNRIGHQLNLKDELFQDDSVKMRPASPNIDTPPRNSTRMTDLNHHFDLLMRCVPTTATVEFLVQSKPERYKEKINPTPVHYFMIRIHIEQTSPELLFYRAKLDIDTKSAWILHSTYALTVPLFSFLLYFVVCGIPFLVNLFMFPLKLASLLLRRGCFLSGFTELVDPLNERVIYVPLAFIILENMVGFIVLLGYLMSLIDMFNVNGTSGVIVGFETKMAAITFWNRELPSVWDVLAQVIFGLWSLRVYHAVGLVLGFMRSMEVTLLNSSTNFLLYTLIIAFIPLVNFLTLFCLILISFAAIVYIVYGPEYAQFSTFTETIFSLFLACFGFEENSMINEKVNPFIEKGAYSLQMILVLFQIMVVTILLNMFTTIVMDAYSVACGGPEKKLNEASNAIWTKLKRITGYQDEVDEEINFLVQGLGGFVPQESVASRQSRRASDSHRALQLFMHQKHNQNVVLRDHIEGAMESISALYSALEDQMGDQHAVIQRMTTILRDSGTTTYPQNSILRLNTGLSLSKSMVQFGLSKTMSQPTPKSPIEPVEEDEEEEGVIRGTPSSRQWRHSS